MQRKEHEEMIMTKQEMRDTATALDQAAIDALEHKGPSENDDKHMSMVVRLIAATAYYVAGGKEAK